MEETEVLTPTQPDFRQRHLSDVTSTLGGLWRRRLYTDLTLVAGKTCLRCHRVVLASASPYFHLRLFNGKRESSTDKIFLRDMSGDVLAEVLEFVYSGECRLREENAEDLLRAATVFQLFVLKEMCDLFLKDHVEGKNAIRLYKVARATRSTHVEAKSREVIRTHLPQLSNTKLFKQLSHHELISILSHCDSSPPLEETVYGAVRDWIQVDRARRKQVLGEILRRVSLRTKHQEELREIVEEDPPKEAEVKVGRNRGKARPTRPTSTTSQDEELSTLTAPAEPKTREKEVEEVLVMVGGVEVEEESYQRSQRAQAFNPSLQQWSPLNPLPLSCDSGAAYCVKGNDILISGVGDTRQDLVRFEGKQNRWHVLAPMSTGRRGHAMILKGPCLYVLGGMVLHNPDSPQPNDPKKPATIATSLVERYDPTTNTWKLGGHLAEAVWGASAVVLKDKIHILGGFQDKDKPTSIVQTFDPLLRTGRVSSQLPFPVALSQVVMTDGAVFLMGPSGTVLTTTDCWRFKVAVSIAGFRRALFGMAVCRGCLYVVGGRCGKKVHDDGLVVDLHSGKIRQLPERLSRPVWGCGFLPLFLDSAFLRDKDLEIKDERAAGVNVVDSEMTSPLEQDMRELII